MKRGWIRGRSKKREARADERQAVRASVYERCNGRCEAKCSPDCRGTCDQIHELCKRSQWAEGIYVESNCIGICVFCHSWLNGHEKEGRVLKLILSRWEIEPPND